MIDVRIDVQYPVCPGVKSGIDDVPLGSDDPNPWSSPLLLTLCHVSQRTVNGAADVDPGNRVAFLQLQLPWLFSAWHERYLVRDQPV